VEQNFVVNASTAGHDRQTAPTLAESTFGAYGEPGFITLAESKQRLPSNTG